MAAAFPRSSRDRKESLPAHEKHLERRIRDGVRARSSTSARSFSLIEFEQAEVSQSAEQMLDDRVAEALPEEASSPTKT